MALTLFILPLYPDSVAGEIYAVDLFRYSQASPLILAAHWVLFVLLFLFGCVKVTMALLKIEKAQKALTIASVAVGIVTVFFLALTREPYATAMAFLLLLSKGVILLKIIKADR